MAGCFVRRAILVEGGVMNSHFEIIEQFRSAMLSEGVTPPETIIPDGALHRFKIGGKMNGFYKLHLDGRAAGCFQDWKQHDKPINWKLTGNFKPFTDEERKAFALQRATEEAKRQKEELAKHNEAARKARYIWSKATPAKTHPYLARKNILPHGSRIGKDNTLIIPLLSASSELVNLQFIGVDGTKRFLSGGKKQGCFYYIGALVGNKILIAEGFATAASIHQDTGLLTIVALDAGNLEAVAKVFRAQYPKAEIIIMADNDHSGTGQEKARAAALAANCKYLVCPVAGMDFNDYLNQGVAA